MTAQELIDEMSAKERMGMILANGSWYYHCQNIRISAESDKVVASIPEIEVRPEAANSFREYRKLWAGDIPT